MEGNKGKKYTQTKPENKIKKDRCAFCNKKYGMIGFTCKCGKTFCTGHRYTHSHNCPHDKKQSSKEYIQKKNPKVEPAKLVDVC